MRIVILTMDVLNTQKLNQYNNIVLFNRLLTVRLQHVPVKDSETFFFSASRQKYR